jgi:hypothetical protein
MGRMEVMDFIMKRRVIGFDFLFSNVEFCNFNEISLALMTRLELFEVNSSTNKFGCGFISSGGLLRDTPDRSPA